MDLDLDLGPWAWGLDLGDWDVGLGLAGTERYGGSFWRLLVSCFQGWPGCRGYLGYVPYTDAMCCCWVQSEEREGTSGHGQDRPSSRTRRQERSARLICSTRGRVPKFTCTWVPVE